MENKQPNTNKEALSKLYNETTSMSGEFTSILNTIYQKLQDDPLLNMGDFNTYIEKLHKEVETKFNMILGDINNDVEGVTSSLSKNLHELQKTIDENTTDSINDFNKSTTNMKVDFSSIKSGITGDASDLQNSFSNIFTNLNSFNLELTEFQSTYKKTIGEHGPIKLIFDGIVGSISLTAWDRNDIEINVLLKSSGVSIDNVLSIIDESQTYGIKFTPLPNIFLSLNINVPKLKFESIDVYGPNVRLKTNGLQCSKLYCSFEKGRVSIVDVKCNLLSINTSDGKVSISGVKCDRLSVKSINSNLIIDDVDSNQLNLSTINGRISFDIPDNISGKKEFTIIASNEPVDIGLPISPFLFYHIDASTSNESIYVDVHDISYSINEISKSGSCHKVFETPNFEASDNQVLITVQASNSLISIKQLNV